MMYQIIPCHSSVHRSSYFQTTLINTSIKSSSGTFNVGGTIKWKGEAHVPSEHCTKKQVRDATIRDSTGSIPMSILGKHITSVKEEEFSTFTECRLYQ